MNQKRKNLEFTNITLDIDSNFLKMIYEEFQEKIKDIDKENWQLCTDILIETAREKLE